MDLNKTEITHQQVVKDFSEGSPDAALSAVAIFAVGQLVQPSDSGIVHCLSNVETKIKTAVVTASKNQHELSRLVLSFGDSEIGVLLGQAIGI